MVKENPDTIGLADAFKELNKTFGGFGLFAGNDEKIEPVEPISSGSLVVDDILGIGGYPRGRMVQFAGKESSGKTFQSIMVIKEWQKKNPKNWALFIDAEYTYDEGWFKALGIDTSRLMIFKESSGTKIWNFLCGTPKQNKVTKKITTTPGLLQNIIDAKEGDDENHPMRYCGVIILDSIAQVVPPVEEASVIGKQNMAPMARFLSDALRRLTPLVGKANVLFISTNHIHINIGQMYGDPETTSGGRAWKHACSTMVNFAAQIQKDNLIRDPSTDEILGHKVKIKIEKNKCAPPNKEAEFDIKYVSGIVNRHLEIGELAIKYNVVERPNNVMYEYGDQKWKGRDNFLQSLETDEKLQGEMLEKIEEIQEEKRKNLKSEEE